MTKWLPDVAPTDRAVDVAALSVRTRLDAVRFYLKRSAERPDEPANVHQLRVWIRRSDAALTLYADLLPKRRLRRLRKVLTRVRRAAGRVRDCDVYATRSGILGGEWPIRLRTERARAHEKLAALYERLDRGRRLQRRVAGLLDRMRKRNAASNETLADRARATLRPLTVSFFRALPPAAADDTALHEFRIRGKELRYAMELLASAFPAGFRDELYPIVGSLQDKLGLVNDLAVAHRRLQKRMAGTGKPAELSELRRRSARVAEDLVRARADFHQWWHPEQSAGLQARFEDLLGSPAAPH